MTKKKSREVNSDSTINTHLPYDVSFVGNARFDPLNEREKINLSKALGTTPSNTFLTIYAMALSSYVSYSSEIEKVSKAKVHARLKEILDCGKRLHESIQSMELSDRCFVGSFMERKLLSDQAFASENEVLKVLKLFLDDVNRAFAEVDAMQRRGRMPAYPKETLALTISQALYVENGKFPAMTRKGTFDQVLNCAIDAGDSRAGSIKSRAKTRQDVMPYMTLAKSNVDERDARQLGEALKGGNLPRS